MLKASITFNTDGLKRSLSEFVRELADDIQATAKKNTPIKTGNARRNWDKQVTDKRAVINNKVPYIQRLEAGASRQAPQGILKPTLTQIKGKYK
jgi:HK97 gp10 family phage protein